MRNFPTIFKRAKAYEDGNNGEELFDFFKKYGKNGIKINVGI